MERDLDEVGEAIIGLAGQIAAATARWLLLVAEFDRRDGWRSSGCHSCAHWLSWRCGIAPSTAYEQVKVARALEGFPVITAAFSAGELTYCKVRALVRMATPATEADLVEMARVCTGAHLASIARAHARAARDPEAARRRQGLRWQWDEDGDLVIAAKLPGEVGRRFLQAMSASASELDPDTPPDDEHGESAAAESEPTRVDSDDQRKNGLAEAFAGVVELALAGAADRSSVPPPPEVVVTVATDDLKPRSRPAAAERRGCSVRPAVDPDLARRLCCDATTATLLHDSRGTPLDLGRRSRTVSHALRVAMRLRDGGCRFPGCSHTRFTQAHHVVHWADGGPTELSNLVTLCTFHHRLLHEGGYSIRALAAGTFQFVRPNGVAVALRPDLHPGAVGTLDAASGDLEPTWGGERLDLGHALDAIIQAEYIAENRRRRLESAAAD